jgi:hypothetical protein
MMDRYFPNSGWLRLRRETLDRLQRFKSSQAVPSWDQAFDVLLSAAERAGVAIENGATEAFDAELGR